MWFIRIEIVTDIGLMTGVLSDSAGWEFKHVLWLPGIPACIFTVKKQKQKIITLARQHSLDKNPEFESLVTVKMEICIFYPYHAEFLKWNNLPSIFGTFHYHFKEISRWKLKVGQPTV